MRILNFEFRIPGKNIYLILFLVTAFLWPSQVSLAVDLQNATGKIEQSHEDLLDARDNAVLSPEEELRQEIAARVKIVSGALALSLQEIGNLRNNLNGLPKFAADNREEILRQGFISDLKTFEDYYASKQDELNQTDFALDSIKSFAQTIIDYRDTIYNSKVSDIVDFSLFFYNEDAIATAKIRLSKIADNIKKLEKLSVIRTGYFNPSIIKATDLLKDSDTLDVKARVIILGAPSINSWQVPLTGSVTNPPQTMIQLAPPTGRELLVKSLGNIRSVYDIFVQIGKDTKRILGIR